MAILGKLLVKGEGLDNGRDVWWGEDARHHHVGHKCLYELSCLVVAVGEDGERVGPIMFHHDKAANQQGKKWLRARAKEDSRSEMMMEFSLSFCDILLIVYHNY